MHTTTVKWGLGPSSSYTCVWTMLEKTMLAKALYDNVAETPDELAFRRGDIVTVLAQDADGLEGWWLCCLRGRKGIAPYNRLKVLGDIHGDEGGGEEQIQKQPDQNSKFGWNRRSWLVEPNKVVTPQKVGSVYVYNQGTQEEAQDYDVPTSRYFPGDGTGTLPNGRGNLPLPEIPTQQTISSESQGLTLEVIDEPCYNVPKSNRSSTVSMLSTGSNNTVSSSNSHTNLRVGSASPSGGHSARSSSELPGQDLYDVPPSHPKSILEQTPLEIVETYDTPSKLKAEIEMREHAERNSRLDSSLMECYDVPSKLKGNVSLDSSILDVYDTPLKKDVSDAPALPAKSRESSVSCALDLYDTPTKLSKVIPEKVSCEDDDYDVPKGESSRSSGDSGIETSKLEIYDTPTQDVSSCVDNEETYDTPINNSATFKSALAKFEEGEDKKQRSSVKTNSVYDVPPQVTRDSNVSSSSVLAVEELTNRISTCSTDSRGSDAPSVPYDELPLNRDSALETLVKLQQDSEKACSHLLSFVNSSWRTPQNFEPKLFSIKLATMAMKTALQELVDFGQGALANSTKVQDKKLVKKLFKHLEPLQTSLQKIKDDLQSLNSKWDLGTLSSQDGQINDELTEVVHEAKDMPSKVATFASLIQGNAPLLFKRIDSTPSTSQPPFLAPTSGASTPKVKPPAPPVKPKPKLQKRASSSACQAESQEAIQSRPLPAPPTVSNDGVYDVPKSCSDKQSSDCDTHPEDFERDYDYVDLTQDDVVASKDNASAKVPEPVQDVKPRPETTVEKCDAARDSVCSEISMSEFDAGLAPPKVRTSGLSPRFKERLEALQAEAQEPVHVHTEDGDAGDSTPQLPAKGQRQSQLNENDKQILSFYASQVETHSTVLINAIDAFFQCVDYNQPPRVFIAHSKFVILAAHKMVYIADTITRYTYSQEVRSKITTCANILCDCLKLAVTATKQAALQYPAVDIVQGMVDKVVDVSHSANELKLVITQAAQL